MKHLQAMKWLKPTLNFLGYALCCMFAVNLVALVLSLFILRGSAWDGMVEGQKYYLGAHGRYTEVSRGVFKLSERLQTGILVTLPLAFVGALVLGGAGRNEDGPRA